MSESPMLLLVLFPQLAKAWGMHVTTTCSTDAVELAVSLGADEVVDYTQTNVWSELQHKEK